MAIVVALTVIAWQWRHPDVFVSSSGAYEDHNWPVGEPMFVGITYEAKAATGTVSLHGAEPHTVQDSAHAHIEFFVCTVDPSSGVGGIGAVTAPIIRRECSSLTPIENESMDLHADPRRQVVMSVTATRPGTIDIEDVSLSFSHGWQRGSERLNTRVVLQAR